MDVQKETEVVVQCMICWYALYIFFREPVHFSKTLQHGIIPTRTDLTTLHPSHYKFKLHLYEYIKKSRSTVCSCILLSMVNISSTKNIFFCLLFLLFTPEQREGVCMTFSQLPTSRSFVFVSVIWAFPVVQNLWLWIHIFCEGDSAFLRGGNSC